MKKIHYGWVVMIACCAVIFTGIGVFSNSVGVFYRPVAASLSVGIGAVSLQQTIRSLAGMAAAPFVTRIFARFTIRRTMAVSMCLACLCYLFMSWATTLWQFYLLSALFGLCGPFLTNIPVPLIINNWFARRTGAVLGLVLSFTGVGGAIMSPVAAGLISRHGWPTAYRAMALIGFLVAVPAIIFMLRVSPEEKNLRPYGATEADKPEPDPEPLGGDRPRTVLHGPSFFRVALYSLLIIAVSAIVSHIPAMAVDQGFSAATGALTASVAMIGLIVGKLVIGSLSDRLGIRRSLTLATLAGVAGALLLILLPGRYAALMGGGALIGVSMALASIATPLLITHVFGRRNYTVASAYISLPNSLASAASVALYGFIFDFTGSYTPSLILIAVTMVLSLFALGAVMRLRPEHPEGEPPAARNP